MLDLLAVGDVMLDVHAPAPSGERLHAPIRVRAGGSAVNVALAAAELGARAGVAGCVGDDVAGRAIAEELARHGVDAHLSPAAAATGTTVYIGLSVVADRGANAVFAPMTLPAARVTLFSGYLSPGQLAAVLPLAHGTRAVDLQGNHHDLPHVDVVLGPEIDIDAWEADVVVSTLGAEGAVATGGVRAAPPAVVADRRGAGDRFAAAFLLAFGELPLEEALRRACAFAAAH